MSQSEQQNKNQVESNKAQDPLLLDKIYKDPLSAFLHRPLSIDELKNDCLIFLDTNVLLIPYSTSKDSLKSFTDIYKILSDQGRLYLADRVMQEFEKNVPDQLKNIFHSLVLGQNYNAPFIDFPLLDGMNEYINLKQAEKVLREKLEDYRKATRATLEAIERWDHNDPVRTTYRSVFSKARRAHITSIDSPEILKQWNYRFDNKIPPGYKDGGKSDSGIGDYLLWQSVLDTCSKEKKDAIVVSSDAKPDWWHKTDNQSLYARRELVEEFRACTEGHTVRLLSPSDFLKLYGANTAIVEEVALEQAQTIAKPKSSDNEIFSARADSIYLTREWLMRFSSNFKVLGNSKLIFTVGKKTHEFKIKYINSLNFVIQQIEDYGNEIAVCDKCSLVLVGPNENFVEHAIKLIQSELSVNMNLIVGFISAGSFCPVYFSNNRQSKNILLEFNNAN